MRHFRSKVLVLPFVLLMIVVSACSQLTAELKPDPAPTVDTEAIAAAVLSEVETKLDSVTAPTPEQEETAFDNQETMGAIMDQVESYLAERENREQVALVEENLLDEDAALETTLIDLYQNANPAVVFILVPPIGSGSGFVFDNEGHIVTNNHVIEFGREFEVIFSAGDRRSAELVGQDVDSDLAVIKVNELPENVEPLTLAPSTEVRVGQFVVAIGNPFGEQGSMSLGIISGLDRSLSSQRETDAGSSFSLPQVIQTDAPINPGNSGGPLLNLEGQVVGVNSAIASTTGANTGVGFSIPSDAVARIIPSLIEKGTYDYPYMGASFDGDISLDDQQVFGLSQTRGAYVVSVTAGGPADAAGLIPADPNTGQGGDLIIDIDGNEINDFSDLNSYLVFRSMAGQTIDITVLRDGAEVIIPLTLGSRPTS